MTRIRPSGAIQARIRAVNGANGWDAPVSLADRTGIVALLALAITEVAEAIEAVRKPPVDAAHLVEELADVTIRLLDLGAGLGVEVLREGDTPSAVPGGHDTATTEGLVAALGVIAAAIGRVIDAMAGAPPSIAAFATGIALPCMQVEAVATALGLDLPGAVEAKVARNATRAYRHGGRAI